jgi:hypothetical protein
MKKLAIVISILMLVALLVPAASVLADTGTQVTVGGTSTATSLPFIKAVWVQEPDNNITLASGAIQNVTNYLESADTSHQTHGTQINPPMIFNSSITLDFFCVASDPAGVSHILAKNNGDIFSWVYSPAVSPSPYNSPTDPLGNGNFKYKVDYIYDLGYGAIATTDVTTAANDGLITFGPVASQDPDISSEGATVGSPYTLANLTNGTGTGELDKGNAHLFEGVAVLTYEQPAGVYTYNTWAIDSAANQSNALASQFTYKGIPGIETDFTQVNYGNVSKGLPSPVSGDLTWGNSVPTVRNIGNVWVNVTVAQNDMAFGIAGTQAGTTYTGTSLPVFNPSPLFGQTNWNVTFDAKMGTNADEYFDPTAKGLAMTNVAILPGVLGLSSEAEMDFSILLNNGSNGSYNGSMVISAATSSFTTNGAVANGTGEVMTTEPAPIYVPVTPVVTTGTSY